MVLSKPGGLGLSYVRKVLEAELRARRAISGAVKAGGRGVTWAGATEALQHRRALVTPAQEEAFLKHGLAEKEPVH